MGLEEIANNGPSRRTFLIALMAYGFFGCRSRLTDPEELGEEQTESTFNILDYWPLEEGNTWNYQEFRPERVVSVEDKDRKRTVVLNEVFTSGNVTYEIKENGIYRVKQNTIEYIPPLLEGTMNMRLGDNLTTSYDAYTKSVGDTKQVLTETGVKNIILLALEDVQVPAGRFKNCLKIERGGNSSTLSGLFTGEHKKHQYWFAKGIGKVKIQQSSSSGIYTANLESYDLK